ncbi:MAG: DUF512 domain-containing protein [Acutalibacteraceae bacterium]|jgi:putative radical SAM enzyme (TIGR03279 family)
MAVTIQTVQPGSPAARKHLRGGMILHAINDHEIMDVLDYRFYMMEPKLTLEIEENGARRRIKLRKKEDEELGLEFETYLMDSQRSCRNKCIFCFIDQLPPGMRPSLYFKDDDSRLSFLFGNYITLTNLTEHEIERIIAMHISPMHVSVHTTNPALRCKMMGNRFAGDCLQILRRFARAGIQIECQLVLCPGYNDGEELRRTMEDLAELAPAVDSVAAVPVGLTRYREGLTPLRPFTPDECAAVVDAMTAMGERMLQKTGNRLFYPADEFYVKSGRPLPPLDFYGELSQLENGVGMMALLKDEFETALEEEDRPAAGSRLLLPTGEAIAPFMRGLVDEAAKKWHNLCVTVVPVKNDFFGGAIDVTGLLTGTDLLAQLKGIPADRVLLADVTLRHDGACFLDDMTPGELEQGLGIPLTVVGSGGRELVDALRL